MSRFVVRPRIQIAILVVIFVVWTCVGASYFVGGDVVAQRDWVGIGLGCLLLVTGPLCLWRAARLGVVIDPDGVRVRGFDSRDTVIPASDVQSVTIDEIGVRAGVPLYAPVLDLGPAGGRLPIRPLGSYSRQDAEDKAEKLRRLLGRPSPASRE